MYYTPQDKLCCETTNKAKSIHDRLCLMIQASDRIPLFYVTAEIYPKVYHTCFFVATYFAPLCLMVLAYIQIFHKLWCQQVRAVVRQPSQTPQSLIAQM